MITVWQGSANMWDCDEMGHMNVRVYVEKAIEGLGVFAHLIDMPHAFRPSGPSTLIPADQHIRFIREVHPGRPLSMNAGVVELGECDAVIYQEMRHGDGTIAASFRTRVIHAEAKSGAAFPWSKRSLDKLKALKCEPPKDGAPRSIEPNGPTIVTEEATLAAAEAVGAPMIGLGCVPQAHCDIHGRMRAPWFMGRISDSVPNLLYEWRSKIADAAGGLRMGAAVLEYRLVYRAWPRAGDQLQIHSGLSSVGEKTHSLVHWMLDPTTGKAWLTSEATAVTFDLDARKAIPTPKEQMAELEKIAPRGLRI